MYRFKAPIPLDGDSATIRNFGPNDRNHSRNDKSAVEAYRNLHDRHLTAIVLTLLKIYVATSPLTQSTTEA